MFCDTCHWYTAGEKICPHCGAEQKPPEPDSILGIWQPAQKPKPAPPPVPSVNFCGRCGARAGAGNFCSRCGAALDPQPK